MPETHWPKGTLRIRRKIFKLFVATGMSESQAYAKTRKAVLKMVKERELWNKSKQR